MKKSSSGFARVNRGDGGGEHHKTIDMIFISDSADRLGHGPHGERHPSIRHRTCDEAGGSGRSAMASLPEGQVNGCGCELDTSTLNMSKDDPIQKHYKKTGMLGGLTGMFGDKKTMYCHHVTADGRLAARAAKEAGETFQTPEQVFEFIGKGPCVGRFAYNRETKMLRCGALVPKDHDNTCNEDTCLFIANGLACPTPSWALK